MAAAAHSARPTFECGALTSSGASRASSGHTLLHKRIRQPIRLVRCREPVLRHSSSFRVQACCSQLCDGGMDEQWAHHCSPAFSSGHPSTKQSDMSPGQVRDDQPRQPSNPEGDDAYPSGLSKKEIERRRKIGAANKGKAPWTKGRKLSEEHKQLIKQRTIEALRDPKVMSCKKPLFLLPKELLGYGLWEFKQSSKDKISAALRKLWERRMVSVRSRQMVLRIWSDSIAEAAKEGDHGQDKLDWDSYDKIQSKMISVFIWNKEKERVTKKLKRAVTQFVAKKLQAAEKMELLTKRTKKAKPEKLVLQKSDAQPRQMLASTRPKLKERLTKWHDRKKELEIVISSRIRSGGGLRKPAAARRRAVEMRAEVDLVTEPGIPTCRPKELQSPGLPCTDT